jgi:hypothetical protein
VDVPKLKEIGIKGVFRRVADAGHRQFHQHKRPRAV